MVAGRREVGEGAETPARVAFRRRRPILFVALLFLGLVTALLIVAWIERRPIAERFIEVFTATLDAVRRAKGDPSS